MLGVPSRATIATVCLAWALALASAAVAWMAPNPKQGGEGRRNLSASGAMSVDNSRAEAAILKPSALAPGGRAVGKVTIRNNGDPGYLVLSRRNLVERSGANGASLGDVLELTVRSIAAEAETVVYSGRLTAMPTLRLGRVPAAAKRRFRFVARLPEPGGVDNALMGSKVRFDYRWRLTPHRP
jgi:hypothetical protein